MTASSRAEARALAFSRSKTQEVEHPRFSIPKEPASTTSAGQEPFDLRVSGRESWAQKGKALDKIQRSALQGAHEKKQALEK